MVDPKRRLFVLQDATGALAVHAEASDIRIQPGQTILLQAAGVFPYFVSLPDFPYRPAGWDVCRSFEAPSNWGNYHLTRMRGYIRPPVSGEYTFWIASDNSSELWLSTDSDPGRIRRIAFVAQGNWVAPRDWTRYASQRSENIFLRGGATYYIEAFQEQLTEADNLAVAWQGPNLSQGVIDGAFLLPWTGLASPEPGALHGIRREYWTNYSAGELATLTGPRPIVSAISADDLRIDFLGPGEMPAPRRIRIGRPLSPADNYCWAEVEGAVGFMSLDGSNADVELVDGGGRTQARIAGWSGEFSQMARNWIRIQGVCEAEQDWHGESVPGRIWAPSERNLAVIQRTNTNWTSLASMPPYHLAQANSNAPLGGYYYVQGVVTFNDRVLDKDCVFIQDNTAGIFLSQSERQLTRPLRVGDLVEVGGQLVAGKNHPSLAPALLNRLGARQLPDPEIQTAEPALQAARDGMWTELEGVIRSTHPNGTLVMMTQGGPLVVWIGRTPAEVLPGYVDSTVRARGVMSLSTHEFPLLLVPSRKFIEREDEPREDPFLRHPLPAASLGASLPDQRWVHRVRISGVVTFRNERVLFVEDSSGSARVQTIDLPPANVGDHVDAVGFPEAGHSLPMLTEARVRRTGAGGIENPPKLDLATIVTGRRNGGLVRLRATLLGEETRVASQVLELQQGQRLFQAILAARQGRLPSFATGSLLELTGVCNVEMATPPALDKAGEVAPSAASVEVFLRSPQDVRLLSGPPWWTWRQAAALVAALLAVLAGTLLWIQLLRRRLDRQQAARLSFSRQILQGQESERRRIAANLHDSLGQNLLVIKNQARLALQPAADEGILRQRLDAISGVASQAIEEVRQITHNLRPYQLDRFGLTQAIRALITRVSENGSILFASHVDDVDGQFDKESEIHLYRIVQEGLNNIVKHSGATEGTVVVKRQPGSLTLSVRDNGRGFDPSLLNAAKFPDSGFGINGISERTRILGGTLALESRSGQGTTLTCEIPFTGH